MKRCLLSVVALVAFVVTPVSAATTGTSAELRDARGQVVGEASFEQTNEGVQIDLRVTNLPPGTYGVHIHEVGACEPPAFTSAGGHFNPENRQHGFENPAGPHAGDLPNLEVGADGTGRLQTTNDRVTLEAGPHSLFDADGSALVVHAMADDYHTDPAGNSGNRIACGVIEATMTLPLAGEPAVPFEAAAGLGIVAVTVGLLLRRIATP